MPFYVTAIEDGVRHYFVAGPFASKVVAESLVDPVRRYCCDRDGRAHFMAWGAARTDGAPRVVLSDLAVLDSPQVEPRGADT